MINGWAEFRRNFPWKDVIIGFLIPKTIFLIGINHNALFLGGFTAIFWCLIAFWVTHIRHHRANMFAILAVIMIVARIVVVLVSKSPIFYLYAQALDIGLFGAIFLISTFFPRSIIQLFVESSGVKIPETIHNSRYYRKCWNIISAVWGITYILTAIIVALVDTNSLSLVAIIDIFAGWPALIALTIFTINFPGWYWARKRLLT